MIGTHTRSLLVFVIALLFELAVLSGGVSPGKALTLQVPSVNHLLLALMVAALAGFLDWRNRQAAIRPAGGKGAFAQATVRTGRVGLEQALNRSARLVGWMLSALAAATRFILGGFGRYRSGGKHGSGGADWGLISVLLAIGGLLLSLGIATNEAPAAVFAALLLGVAAAIGYDHGVGQVFRFARPPRLRDAMLLAICLATAIVTIASIATALGPLWPSGSALVDMVDIIERVLLAAGGLLIALPLLGALSRPLLAGQDERPLWPPVAAFLGGGAFLQVASIMWSMVIDTALWPYNGWAKIVEAWTVAVVLGLPLGAGALTWYQAASSDARAGFEWSQLFPASLVGWAGLIAIAMLLNFSLLLSPGDGVSGRQFSMAVAAVSIGVACFAWLIALRRIADIQPRNPLRVVIASGLLTALFPITVGLSGLIATADAWGPVLIIFTMPIAIAAWAFTTLAVPPLLRWALGERTGSFA